MAAVPENDEKTNVIIETNLQESCALTEEQAQTLISFGLMTVEKEVKSATESQKKKALAWVDLIELWYEYRMPKAPFTLGVNASTEESMARVDSEFVNPDEIYIDTTDHGVIYIKYLPKDEIVDGRNIIKIPVNVNSIRTDRPVNYLGTTSRIPLINIQNDPRYKKIE